VGLGIDGRGMGGTYVGVQCCVTGVCGTWWGCLSPRCHI
jgi:hypothetical protein